MGFQITKIKKCMSVLYNKVPQAHMTILSEFKKIKN